LSVLHWSTSKIPEQAKELGISEQEVIDNVMLKDTVDHQFTTVTDVAETALFLALSSQMR
jgi:3-hydroxybutyrate dehydrogenase